MCSGADSPRRFTRYTVPEVRTIIHIFHGVNFLINNVMTIEPGIYLAGWGGVRIEDDVIIGKDNCEILNKTTKDLFIID